LIGGISIGDISVGVDLGAYAGFGPGLVVAIVLALVLCGRAARALGIGRAFAWLLLVSLGVILAATVTPGREALHGISVAHGCDLSRIGPAPWSEYSRLDDASLNILLFVPLGVLIGLLPASRSRTGIVVAALALPFVIEITQLVVVPLGRACQTADMSDNLLGVFLGLGVGLAVAWIRRSVRR